MVVTTASTAFVDIYVNDVVSISGVCARISRFI